METVSLTCSAERLFFATDSHSALVSIVLDKVVVHRSRYIVHSAAHCAHATRPRYRTRSCQRHRSGDCTNLQGTVSGRRTGRRHPSTGGGVYLSGARSWATPLGHVQVAADICEMLSGTVGCSETEAGIPARHAPWLWFTAAQYDCERRENIVVPQLAAVGVDEALTAEEPTAAKLTQAIVTAVRSVAPRRRVAIIAAVEALDGEPHGNLTMIALRCAEAIVGTAPKPYTLGTSGEEPLGPWICTAVASSPCPAPASAGLEASTSTTKLYRYTEGSGWGAPLRWAENHGPCSCDDPASSWGRPQEFHDAAVRFADNELHAIWTPALSATEAGTGSSAPLSRGVLVTCPGAGASAGPCGAFGPFCIFSRLARSLREHGVSTLQIIYPQWSAGKPSVAGAS